MVNKGKEHREIELPVAKHIHTTTRHVKGIHIEIMVGFIDLYTDPTVLLGICLYRAHFLHGIASSVILPLHNGLETLLLIYSSWPDPGRPRRHFYMPDGRKKKKIK